MVALRKPAAKLWIDSMQATGADATSLIRPASRQRRETVAPPSVARTRRVAHGTTRLGVF